MAKVARFPRFHMYQLEYVFVLVVLSGVALWHGNTLTEWVGVAAVFFGFCHMSVGLALEMKQSTKAVPDEHCYWKMSYFLYAKEAAWLVYFLLLHAYTALAGVLLFAVYPVWRRYYKARLSGRILKGILKA